MEEEKKGMVDFGKSKGMAHGFIKVVGVGGGGCNAVQNMYEEGIDGITFAVCNTDSQPLAQSKVPVKLLLGERGLGVGGVPEKAREEAEASIDKIKILFSDDTEMVFVTAGMGGGTGTGAAPVVAGVARSMGLLTVGVVTIPFYFEKEKKIIKALKGVEEMRKNVDALLIVNNESLCDVYADSKIPVKEAFKSADNVLCNAVKSIAELITVEGDINLDFRDVESTMKNGGEAIMAIGRAHGERRVEAAISNALDSPLLYGNDVSKAKRILLNIYTSEEHPLLVNELEEIDDFMNKMWHNLDVIWGVSDDNSLGEDAKIAILATGMDDDNSDFCRKDTDSQTSDDEHYRELIKKLYKPKNSKARKSSLSETDDRNTSEGSIDSVKPGKKTATDKAVAGVKNKMKSEYTAAKTKDEADKPVHDMHKSDDKSAEDGAKPYEDQYKKERIMIAEGIKALLAEAELSKQKAMKGFADKIAALVNKMLKE